MVSFIIQIIKQLDSAVIHITRYNFICCGHCIPKLSTLATPLLPNFLTKLSTQFKYLNPVISFITDHY